MMKEGSEKEKRAPSGRQYYATLFRGGLQKPKSNAAKTVSLYEDLLYGELKGICRCGKKPGKACFLR